MNKHLLPAAVALFVLFGAVSVVSSQTWMQNGAPVKNWVTVASSADGMKLIASDFNTVYTSTNSGANWFSNTTPVYAMAVASSADGNYLAAAGGWIYTSTNGGVNWVQTSSPFQNWQCIACSADGSKLAAGTFSKGIYTSLDHGATWTSNSLPNAYWKAIASSADGVKLVAAAYEDENNQPGTIYVSTNAGATWMQASVPSNRWSAVTSSADGQKLMALGFDAGIHVSTNGGVSWTLTSAIQGGLWNYAASSADGNKLVATHGGSIYTSLDSGTTWMLNNAPYLDWIAVASSADGTRLQAAVYRGGIYTLPIAPLPSLNIAAGDGNAVLSWLVPSTNFALQQKPDLSTTNWVEVTNTPMLNLSNLQNEVILSLSNDSRFFRLATP
ncbi:MAG: hypothetical protein HY298_26875 [Verrucomicrobia bacterium]|nr:hypothetical protein [Verrucomicrobiota bacterium]